MDKQLLTSFISKYTLGGMVDAAEWSVDGNTLSTKFISDTQDLLGDIKCNLSAALYDEPVKFGISNTELLVKMISVLDSDVNINFVKSKANALESLQLSDDVTMITYMLADPSIFEKVPSPKDIIEPSCTFSFDGTDLISKILKAISAFGNNINTFMFTPKKKNIAITLGSSANKISIAIDSNVTGNLARPIAFKLSDLKEILSANKNTQTSVVSLFDKGLCKFEFTDSNYKTSYFMVEKTTDF